MKKQNPGDLFNAFQAKKHKKHHKNWIAGAIKHPGALHKQLGIAAGKKIPAKTLAKAAKKGGKEGKRARLAMTLKKLHHKKKMKLYKRKHKTVSVTYKPGDYKEGQEIKAIRALNEMHKGMK